MSKKTLVTKSSWARLRSFTNARIALGHAGESLPTDAHLAFQLDHARARDAVHTPLDFVVLSKEIAALGFTPACLKSRAETREDYLRNPNLGRRLDKESLQTWQKFSGADKQVLVVIGDGLSSRAIQLNAAKLLAVLNLQIYKAIPLIRHARVAIGDELAFTLGAKLVLMLIGERPGLSSAENISVYLTYQPIVGTTDEARNCISNIGGPGGLTLEQAATKITYLAHRALKEAKSGLQLKDELNDLQLPK